MEPEAVQEALQEPGDTEPRQQAEPRGKGADAECLDDDGAQDLPACAAEGPQQGSLPAALGHEDREGVGDGQRRHEQGDPREHHEDAAEGREEGAAHVGDCLLRRRGTGQGVEPRRQHPLDPGGDLGLAHAGPCPHDDVRRLACWLAGTGV